jgi:hypothetical protein
MEEIGNSANQKKGFFRRNLLHGPLPGLARSFPEVIYLIE